ncbi:Uncharacterised protein [Neisseria mucosa]|nr:Uncharacterised protein [Neisseria mucosa]
MLTPTRTERSGGGVMYLNKKETFSDDPFFIQLPYFRISTNIRHTTNPAAAKIAAAKPMLDIPAHTVT